MRNAFLETLTALGKEDSRIRLICADIGYESVFHRDLLKQFLNVGVAEQIMVGMAAGMALRGLLPFCYTIAPLALYRPFEFIRDDVCLQNLPVTIVGMGAGMSYPTLGRTHQAVEDLAIANAIGLRLLAPCDPRETSHCVTYAATLPEPTYLRLGKAGEPDLTSQAEPWVNGVPRYLKRGSSHLIAGYGPILSQASQIDPEASVVILPQPSYRPTPPFKADDPGGSQALPRPPASLPPQHLKLHHP